MTERRLVLESGAESEIQKAIAWYEQQRPSLALELAREVREAFEQVLGVPDRTLVAPGIAPELDVRRLLLKTFPTRW